MGSVSGRSGAEMLRNRHFKRFRVIQNYALLTCLQTHGHSFKWIRLASDIKDFHPLTPFTTVSFVYNQTSISMALIAIFHLVGVPP